MLSITPAQLQRLDASAFEQYVQRLVARMQAPVFASGLAAYLASGGGRIDLQALARQLIAQAARFGYVAEGDVTPFCLLIICDQPAFRQTGVFDWIRAIVLDTAHDPRARMDAVHALLPAEVRALIFAEAD